MPMLVKTLVCTLLCAGLVVAQPPVDKVLTFAQNDSAQDMQDIASTIKYIAGVPQPAVDPAQRTLALHAVASQVALAEWLFQQLDGPANSASQNEYRMSAAGDDIVHIFKLAHAETAQQIGEITTSVRTTADIPRIYTYNSAKIIVARATAVQIALAAWLLERTDLAAGQQPKASDEYSIPGGTDDHAQVFYLTETRSVQEFAEVATLMRSITECRRAYTYNTAKALLMRGTAAQLAFAGWLTTELNRAPADLAMGPEHYQFGASGDSQVSIYYLTHTPTVADFQTLVTGVRTAAQIRRMYTYNALRAVVLRGTPNQVAQAQQLIAERYK
jgi:hypothetical protein